MKPDLTIIGGGLGGLSLAIAMQKHGLEVELHEASQYPRHRVCGEFIRGVSNETLEYLGIMHAFRERHTHRSLAWHRGDHLLYEGQLSTPAIGISRYLLDEFLAKTFQDNGGNLCTNSRSALKGEGVIHSTGRKRKAKSPWIGLKIHIREIDLSADLEMHVGSQNRGYVGLTKVDGGWVNVSGLFHQSTIIKGHKQSHLTKYSTALHQLGLCHLVAQIRKASYRKNSMTGVEGLQFGWVEQDGDNFQIGDTISMIPPFTGNGMSIAFESSALAVEPLLAWHDGKITWEKAQSIYNQRIKKRFKHRINLAHRLHPLITNTKLAKFIDPILSSCMSPIPLLAETLR